MAASNLPSMLLVLVCTALVWFCWRLYRHRSWINRLRKEGMPMPAWSWLSGHIFLLYSCARRLPPLANINLVFPEIAAGFAADEMFLLDIWPLSEAMLVVFNPEAAVHVCQKLNLPKVKTNEEMIRPITGGLTLLSMNGEDWRKWRALFNPGFSTGVMTEQLPPVVDAVARFCETLKECAGKGVLCLDELTTRLTFEVIMKVTLDADIGEDYDHHVFVRAMGNIVKWHSFWDPLILLNPLRPFVQWYNGHVVDSWVRKELQKRFQILQQERPSPSPAKGRAKSVMDLAIEADISAQSGAPSQRLDAAFLETAIHQIRLFLFAGNDTTSSTIVFAYHLLSKNPSILAQLREEHDAVFGTDPSRAAAQLKQDASLLSKCRYTHAVIKETLRLYPPAATMRIGTPGSSVRTRRGTTLPVAGLTLLISHHTIHRVPSAWLQPNAFLPERWLVGPEHALYPAPGAYRPFEIGPRNCIGQTLSLNEIKVVLIMTARSFEIRPAYEEYDVLKGRKGGGRGVTAYRGDRAYQTERAGAHPSEGYPCRVSLRD